MSLQPIPPTLLLAVILFFVTNISPVKYIKVYVHNDPFQGRFCEEHLEEVDLQQISRDLEDAFVLFFEEKRFIEAHELYAGLLESESKTEVMSDEQIQIARFNLASVCNNLGDYDCAIHYMSDLVFDQMDHIRNRNISYMGHAYRLLGELLLIRRPNIPEFVNMMHEASEFYKEKVDVRRRVVEIAAQGAQYWEQLAKGKYVNSTALFNAGILMYEVGRKHDAFKFLSRFRKRHDANKYRRGLGYFYLGLIYTDRRMYDHAWKALLKFVKLRPADYRGLMMLARAFRDSGHPKRAAQTFWRAVDLDPQKWSAYYDAIEMLTANNQNPWAFINRGLYEGVIHTPSQMPRHLVRGLTSQPWHETDELIRAGTVSVNLLQQQFEFMKPEVLNAVKSGVFFNNALKDELLQISGGWYDLNLYDRGIRFEKTARLLPLVTVTLERIPDLTTHVKGTTCIRIISPGTTSESHAGPSNTRIRLIIPLKVPPEPGTSGITVGNITKTFQEAKVIAFDDSYEHWFYNDGSEEVVLLMADIWHPEMTHEDQIQCLENMLEVDRYLYWMNHYNEDGSWKSLFERMTTVHTHTPSWADPIVIKPGTLNEVQIAISNKA